MVVLRRGWLSNNGCERRVRQSKPNLAHLSLRSSEDFPLLPIHANDGREQPILTPDGRSKWQLPHTGIQRPARQEAGSMSLWPEGLAALAGRRVRSLGVLPPRWSIGRNGAFDPLQTQSAGRAVRVQGYFPVGS